MSCTLIDHFDQLVLTQPEKCAYIFIENDITETVTVSYQELQQLTLKVAAYLQKNHFTGKKILLCYSGGIHFIASFLGCLYAGATAVLFPYVETSTQNRQNISKLFSN